MRSRGYGLNIDRKVLVCLLVLLTALGAVFAQQSTSTAFPTRTNSDNDRTKAIPAERSRAQQEADQLVALSADKIISLLSEEPGLFLECKKILVRTAFNRGQILQDQD